MKYKVEVIVLVKDEAGREMKRIMALEKPCGVSHAPGHGLGMTIMDSKNLLEAVQKSVIETEVEAITSEHANCKKCEAALKNKGTRSIVCRTLGDFQL